MYTIGMTLPAVFGATSEGQLCRSEDHRHGKHHYRGGKFNVAGKSFSYEVEVHWLTQVEDNEANNLKNLTLL
jgi:hypothetical protein